MPYGLYISAEGALVQARRLEVIANNLANADTVGFKRDVLQTQARHAEAIEQGQDVPENETLNNLGGGVRVVGTATDFSPGPLKRTGRPTDLAIAGPGFFMVRRGEQNYLTRAGNFELTAQGQLTTVHGDPVLAADGAPVQLDPTLPWYVTETGEVVQAGEAVPLALVMPREAGDLTKVGENLFLPVAPVEPVPPPQRRVLSGHLEQSTVRPIQEMLAMIETTRAFEANMRLIQHQDLMLGQMIGRLLTRT